MKIDSVEGSQITLRWQSLREADDSGLLVGRIRSQGEIGPHDHVFHELVLVEAGTVQHETAGGTQRLRPGDIIVIRPQVWHAYKQPRGLGIINILIDQTVMNRLGPLLTGVSGAFELFRHRLPKPRQTPPVVLHASPTDRVLVLNRLESVMLEQRERRNGWQAASTAGLLDVLVATARLSQDQHASATSLLPDRAEQAVLDVASHIESNFKSSIRLDDLAAMTGISPAHLSRSFSRRMGMGIIHYLHRVRAEEACRLLRYSKGRISDIAGRVGYDEIAYFSRCFRSQTGQSPRDYRRAWVDTPAVDSKY